MKVQIFLIFVVCNIQTNATSYRKGKDLDVNEVELLFRQDTPSQINCANRCALKMGDFVYKEGKCTCFLYLKDQTKKSRIHPKTLTGTFYEKENVCLIGNGGCHPYAKCTNNIGTNGAISCRCNPGYSGSGLTCTDVNECLTNNGDCDENANCTNIIGSRLCTCKKGYTGNGLKCTDVNECLTNNGDCDKNANCTNTIGSSLCTCKNGYNGNGLSCTDINECSTNNGDCDANAICTNTIGSRTCSCKRGYNGNGLKCAVQCTKMNVNGHQITKILHVKTWEECGRKCEDTPNCVLWKWHTHSYGYIPHRETCVLFSSHTWTKKWDDIISGVPGCVV